MAAEIKISGVVQGVGFRYFCCRAANKLDLKGWVKNNFDGSVTTLAEGDRGAIESFISQLKIGPASASVRSCNIQWLPFTGKFNSFSITV